MNQTLKLKTDGFTGDDLKFVEGLNEVFAKADLVSVPQIEKAINEVKSEFENVVTIEKFKESIDEVKQLYANQNGEILALKERGNDNKKSGDSFAEKTWKALQLHQKALALLADNGAKIYLSTEKTETELAAIKAAGTMTTANITASVVNAIPFELSDNERGLTRIQRRRPFLFNIVNTGRVNSMYYQWAEQANADPGVAGSVSEGGVKPQTDFDIVEKSAKVEKIAAHIKVSRELLADVQGLYNEINTELRELVLLKADQLVLSGTGATPDLKGILQFAQAFSSAPFTNLINNANNFDVLRVAINQIEKENFYPTAILMHPSDIAAMELTKNANDSYIMPPFAATDGTAIKGIPVYANTGVAEGTFVVGDFTKAYFKVREDYNLSIGYVNDDFTRNLVTILGEMRGVFFIKSNHVKAFVYGTFATAKAALETP